MIRVAHLLDIARLQRTCLGKRGCCA